MDVMGRKFKPLFPGELEEWEGKIWEHEDDEEENGVSDGTLD